VPEELDIASHGETIQEARENLREAIELFLEEADRSEVRERLDNEQYVSLSVRD
jgi:predicted RNase H-like HicB family nuclease